MKRWTSFATVASAAVMGLAVTATSTPASAECKMSGRNVKIGVMMPLTGKGADWGQNAQIGTQLAVDEINAKGGVCGVKIKPVYYDTHTKESEGITIVNKLATRDNVLAINGPCFSSVVEVIFPMLNELKVPTISYCSAKPGLSELSEWGFRNSLTSDKQLAPVVKAWAKEYSIKKVVVIHDLEDAVSKAEGTKVYPLLFKQEGIEIIKFITYRSKDTDFSAQVTEAKSLNPDGIALGSCYQQAAGIIKEARKQGMKQPFIGGACVGTPALIELAGADATEGTYVSTAAWMDDPRDRVQTFVKAMHKKNGGKAFPYSAPRSYDTMYILAAIMEKYGVTNKPGDLASDRDKIRKGWQELKGFDGVSGETAMNEVGDGAGGVRVLKVVGGKYADVTLKE